MLTRVCCAAIRYKRSISVNGVVNGDEKLMFHGCAETAMDIANDDSIVKAGFLKKFWKSSAGDWQRFGPGFYFGPQSSKAHEYPLLEMQQLETGKEHTRKMLLCKVAVGKFFPTAKDMDTLAGAAPDGHDSVYAEAKKHSTLNYDEYVVYQEEAVLPWLVVEYRFKKL